MTYHDLSNLDHDPKLAISLGNMVVAWARAESAFCCLLSRITGMKINMCILGYYRIPTFEARRKFIQALMVEWQTERFDKVAIAKEVDGLSDLSLTRNDWVHGVWCTNHAKTETVIFDFRRPEGSGRRKPVNSGAVKNHVDAVNKRTETLHALVFGNELTGGD